MLKVVDSSPVPVGSSDRLALALQPVPLALPLVILSARVLDIDVWPAAAGAAQAAAESSGQPALNRPCPLHVHQNSSTVYFLTVCMLISG